MSTSGSSVDHRALGVELFNATWTLIDKPDRDADDDLLMVHSAHASAYHWRLADGARVNNFARSEWLVSRVYAVVGRAEPAGYHAQRCLEICQRYGIGDWDLAFGYEALARAASTAGELQAANRWAVQARAASGDIAEDEDRAQLLTDLASIAGLASRD